jgi:hypothetical protein
MSNDVPFSVVVEYSLQRWRFGKTFPSCQCGYPHFADFPPELREQAKAEAVEKSRVQQAAYLAEWEEGGNAQIAYNNTYFQFAQRERARDAELAAARLAVTADVARCAAAAEYMRRYREKKRAHRPVHAPFCRRAYMRNYMRQMRAAAPRVPPRTPFDRRLYMKSYMRVRRARTNVIVMDAPVV